MRWWTCAAMLTALSSASAAEAPKAGGDLILDESAYCKPYYQFGWHRLSAEALKNEAEELLGERELTRMAADVKARLADREIDWSKEDWRDHAVFRGFRMGGTRDIPKLRAARTDPPPAGWAGTDFDDARWLRFRMPFAVGDASGAHFGQWRCQGPGLQAAFFRYRFVVDDPARAGDLTVALSYYGGAAVYVNGEEVARGHLPAGEITRDTWAEDYPLGAYRRLWSELSEKEQARAKRKGWVKGKPPRYFSNVGHRVASGSRVYGLRNRRLGPVRVPARLLRAGSNVLAVEVRAAPLHPAAANREWLGTGGEHSCAWLHARLTRLSLRGGGGQVRRALTRPPGVQVWAEDMNRRVFSPEFLEPGQPPGRVRLVGGPNGTYAGQIVVGADRELTGVKVAAGPLRSDGGGVIPARAVRVLGMIGHPIGGMVKQLGQGRIPVFRCAVTGREPPPIKQALLRFAPKADEKKARAKAEADILYFDHITRAPAGTVPAGSCRPYWLSVRVPPDAAPGRYRGAVGVEAGGERAAVPVELEVVSWRVPEATDFQVHMAAEQSPYAVARQYGVELWTEAHWRLIEASLARLARIGNDWWFVPVLRNTEFGNEDDSMILWYREPGGADGRPALAFDYRRLDRYLDLIVKHCGRPKVVSFVVMHGAPCPVEVTVFDTATGRPERVHLGGAAGDPVLRRTCWAAFANALYRHMRARGLADAMHWGYAWDTEGDPKLKGLLASVIPEVRWTSGSHNTKRGGSGGGGRLDTSYYRSTSEIYSLPLGARSRMGWKNREIRLNTPRAESTCGCIEGHTMPFGYRLIVDRAVVSGFNGLGRIGGDYWAGTYWRGMRGSLWHMAGFPILTVLWPGADGAECSQRFEALIEGLQEAEARVFIEQAIERGAIAGELARRAQAVLRAHNHETLSLPTHVPGNLMGENAQGWFARSRRLYAAAAAVAGAVGLDVDRTQVRAAVAPLGRPTVQVRLRNWTGRPQAWTAAAGADWLACETTAGKAEGFQPLRIRIDGSRLTPETTATGTVTVVAAGHAYPVTVTAEVGKVFDVPDRVVLNAAPGRAVRRTDVALFNSAAAELDFEVAPSADWVEVAPSKGRIGPGRIAFLTLTVRAPRAPGAHRAALASRVGEARKRSELTVYVVPPYEAPEPPTGKPVWLLEALRTKAVRTVDHVACGVRPADVRKMPPAKRPHLSWFHKSPMYNGHNFTGGAREHMVYERDRRLVPWVMGGRTFQRGYWGFPRGKVTYDVSESGFSAFSAWVGFSSGMRRGLANRAAVCNCEIHVDGEVRAQSGLIRLGDAPRLLVVRDLDGAKTLTLVTRTATGESDPRVAVAWGDPRFHRK